MGDVDYMAPRLRLADADEIRAWGGHPKEELEASFRQSEQPMTVELEGRPVLMFGCNKSRPDKGIVWMLATDRLRDIKWWLLRNSRRWLDRITVGCICSGNVVDRRNVVHIRWLKWLGYKMQSTLSVGEHQFLKFEQSHVYSRRSNRSGHRRGNNRGSGAAGS